jgi:hypothetical protein
MPRSPTAFEPIPVILFPVITANALAETPPADTRPATHAPVRELRVEGVRIRLELGAAGISIGWRTDRFADSSGTLNEI